MSNWRKVWNLLDLITIIIKFWYFLTLALGCDGLVVVQFEAPILILFSTGVNWFKNRGDVDLSPKVAYLSSATSQRSEFNQLWWGFAKKKNLFCGNIFEIFVKYWRVSKETGKLHVHVVRVQNVLIRLVRLRANVLQAIAEMHLSTDAHVIIKKFNCTSSSRQAIEIRLKCNNC